MAPAGLTNSTFQVPAELLLSCEVLLKSPAETEARLWLCIWYCPLRHKSKRVSLLLLPKPFWLPLVEVLELESKRPVRRFCQVWRRLASP
jgi:hypothetical protein